MFEEFISFNKMLTPTLIKIVFWLGVAISVLPGLLMMFDGGFSVIIGLILIAFGPLMVRIYCELLIVIFKIHESLNDMNQKLDKLDR
ncbi:hypothetical protein J2Z83_003499 [Virgibacillus natechei]|uniref:DUF4282 domain-containing protein n=1 Tax=Virgibacillus natechei TaxID=1216297 RepID=A0ABS4ILD5_9BACI|nr:DUF4282 domain-containing protein [Virgibacillus natechei]MBP1971360.1 hypothetical protein [Virgibacillus natechei]UZD12262.1 DUF4282 domain-containing protein [Virgibacillus natechei]